MFQGLAMDLCKIYEKGSIPLLSTMGLKVNIKQRPLLNKWNFPKDECAFTFSKEGTNGRFA